jgi:hypothetical protein
MKNKLEIEKKLTSIGYSLGTYDSKIEKLPNEELGKILNNLEYGSSDIGVTIDRNEYVVEIFHVDNEIDFKLITTKEYAKTYGRIFSKS